MPEEKHPLKVFLCHAHGDKIKARELYDTLQRCSIQPWLDAEDLLPGQDWQLEIPQALKNSDSIIIFLSKASVNKEGYFQKEIKFSLDKALEIPEGRIFLIPARLEECQVPHSLDRYQWVDLFDKDGHEKLIKTLRVQAEKLERLNVRAPQLIMPRSEVVPWKNMTANLAERWLGYNFGPSFLFWVSSFTLFSNNTGWREMSKKAETLIQSQQGNWMIPALLVLALLVLAFSTVLMQVIRRPILRFLEGYWPWPFSSLGLGIVALQRYQFLKRYDELHQLRLSQQMGKLSAVQRERLIKLDIEAHWHPAVSSDLLPTGLGNILRARERGPEQKYGLDTRVCLPRLLPLLPENMRADLAKARSTLDGLAELWFWGLAFIIWALWIPWAMVISIFWMIAIYGMAVQAAKTYGDLLEAAFDVHRFSLYDEIGWDRPKSSEEEKLIGFQLTEYLWRGTLPQPLTYRSKAL